MPNYLAFASDNYAGICPEAWQAMAEANAGFVSSYGDDPWTAKACSLIRDTFETDCQVFFVFNGTAANSLALASLCQSYHSVICHELAHIETDECGAPEFFSNGTKILPATGANGKLDLAAVEQLITRRTDIHYPKPRVVSLTQATELGTLYSPAEVAATGELARRYGLRLQMDGARFANAAASLGCHPGDITWRAGVDVLCLGGAKNGMAVGEAVVFFKKELAEEFDYRCKQAGQLASKMRFLAAPWNGMLQNDAWLKRASHANHCAQSLAKRLRAVPQLEIMFPVEANAVFVSMPQALVDSLHRLGWHFYSFIGAGGARLMCSWATEESDIEALVGDIQKLAAENTEFQEHFLSWG
ncbi:low specificity L-threonine aldolase [Trichlorobacter lovleyi]|uniref:threonine aldolase family protein n=1 Tax=Trichlorobacter lovleyi TaxID=313985 RepID=UPI00223FF85E|nr:low specificity L-threonine aldolase [Trichlorobacter lovleyi]QOX80308.1 low specificity L-threonine aldolase [Trichlorobacter lovleyi]